MPEWLVQLAREHGVDLTDEVADRILNVAALVAHATDRKNAPITAFVLGLIVAHRGDTQAAILEARRRIATELAETVAP